MERIKLQMAKGTSRCDSKLRCFGLRTTRSSRQHLSSSRLEETSKSRAYIFLL